MSRLTVRVNGYWNSEVRNQREPYRVFETNGAARRIIQFEELSACQFRITLGTPGERALSGSTASFPLSATPVAVPPVTLDLSRVTVIQAAADSPQMIKFDGDRHGIRFTTPDSEMRSRIINALDFLRQRCDATADTGF